MKTIHKFPISAARYFEVEMPDGAHLLDVQVQGGQDACIWALVDTESPMRRCKFCVFTTGENVTEAFAHDTLAYVGTFQVSGWAQKPLVFHLFRDDS